MRLTDIYIRKLKIENGLTAKLSDGGGLFLFVLKTGTKSWRYLYRFNSQQKTYSIGLYPDLSLKDARDIHAKLRNMIAKGIDPMDHKKVTKSEAITKFENTFEVIGRDWHAQQLRNWSPGHGARILTRLEKDIFPWIGKIPITELTAPKILETLRRIEDRGAHETAHRALQNCGQIMKYAIATGRASIDVTSPLSGALTPAKKNHLAAITEPNQVGPLLRALDHYAGSFVTKCALRLAPLLFVRPGELRQAKWEEIDFESAEWRYEISKTKTQHIVPLASQAISILSELKALTGTGIYVFPSKTSSTRPMSDNAVLSAMRRMGIGKEEMSGHGFRAMARTILDERLGVRPDYIEHQLGHAVRDPNGRAYNRTAHLKERKVMMQQWADYLDNLKKGAEVLPFLQRA